MNALAQRAVRWWVGPGITGPSGHVLSRWLFLRALGFIYFSAFYSLVFQIRGLLGPNGLLPAGTYLQKIAELVGPSARYWYAPTLLWLDSSNHALMALCWIGMIASLLLFLNLWPRATLVICFVLFLSFVTAAQDFSGYQSDGMLLAAGFISFFFVPDGLRPGWGTSAPPSRASIWLLRLLWFSIYFESGFAKYFGGDPSWRDLTAMDEYYQNGPLPTWLGWYVQQLPHCFHAAFASPASASSPACRSVSSSPPTTPSSITSSSRLGFSCWMTAFSCVSCRRAGLQRSAKISGNPPRTRSRKNLSHSTFAPLP